MNDKRIILGIETEYGFLYEKTIIINNEKTKIFESLVNNPFYIRFGNPEIYRKFLFYHQSQGLSEWLVNGGRLCYEGSVLPEFNTPECLSVRELVAYDKAGDMFLSRLFEASREKKDEKVFILKDNRGLAVIGGLSYEKIEEDANGCHENYGFYADYLTFQSFFGENSNAGGSLLSFLTTRQILAGSGFLYYNSRITNNTLRKNKYFFSISQRADFIGSLFSQSSNSRSERPIITKKEESLAEIDNFHRLHLSCGDSNLSEFSTYLKIGTTRLVIRMILENILKDSPRLDDPVGDFHRVSDDIEYQNKYNVNWPILTNGSGKVSAVEIQEYYCESALNFLSKIGGSAEEWQVAKYWRQTLDLLKADPDQLNDRLDYRIKLSIFNAYLKKHKSSWEKVFTVAVKAKGSNGEILEVPIIERLKGIDLSYHDIRPQGIYNQLVAKGKVVRILDDEEIDRALVNPPVDTRANMRGKFVQRLLERMHDINLSGAAVAEIDWSKIKYNEEYFNIGNPLESNRPSFKDFLDSI